MIFFGTDPRTSKNSVKIANCHKVKQTRSCWPVTVFNIPEKSPGVYKPFLPYSYVLKNGKLLFCYFSSIKPGPVLQTHPNSKSNLNSLVTMVISVRIPSEH